MESVEQMEILEQKIAALAVILQRGTRQNVELYKEKQKQQARLFGRTPPGGDGVQRSRLVINLFRKRNGFVS